MSDDPIVNALTEAMRNADYNQPNRSVSHAILDYKLPACVRAYLVFGSLPATEAMILTEAGYRPALYAKYKDQPCRVTLVSSLGDIGIHFDLTEEHTNNVRGLSIYDLTDFSDEPPLPDKRPDKKLGPLDQELMGVAEIAEYRNVSKQVVSNWQKRNKLPPRLQRLAQGPIWRTSDIVEFFAAKEKRK